MLVRRSRGFGAASIALAVTTVLAAIAVPFTNYAEQATPTAIATYGAIFLGVALAAFLGFYRARRDDVTFAASVEGLSVGGAPALRFRRGEAAALPDGRARVDLRAWPRRVWLEVEDLATARDVLAALGLDRRAGTSRFRVKAAPRPRDAGAGLAIGAATVALAIATAFYGLLAARLALLAFGALAARLVVGRLQTAIDLTIGADGVEIRRRWSRPVFLPHARIRAIERVDGGGHPWFEGDRMTSHGFAIILDDGAHHVFDTREERFRANVWATDPIYDAVRAARDAARSSSAGAPAAALARGARSTREWIDALRGLASEQRAHYRVAALDARALFDVLADPTAPRELRTAAAVALGASAEHAPRLRVAADDVADGVVRRVAVAATAADEAALEEAVDEAAAAEARAASRFGKA